jgi:hypothetical protein
MVDPWSSVHVLKIFSKVIKRNIRNLYESLNPAERGFMSVNAEIMALSP